MGIPLEIAPFIYAQLFIFILFLLVCLFNKTEKQLIKHDLGQKWCKIEKKEVKQRRNGCKKYKYMQFNNLNQYIQLESIKTELVMCKKLFVGVWRGGVVVAYVAWVVT